MPNIYVSNNELEFLRNFIKDEHMISIPISRYAWVWKLHNKSNLNPRALYNFVRAKADESGEDFSSVCYEYRDLLIGSILSHRIFMEWFLQQEYKED